MNGQEKKDRKSGTKVPPPKLLHIKIRAAREDVAALVGGALTKTTSFFFFFQVGVGCKRQKQTTNRLEGLRFVFVHVDPARRLFGAHRHAGKEVPKQKY